MVFVPKTWVREMLNKDKNPYEHQIIYKNKCIRVFKGRAEAEAFVKMMNLLLKE